VQPVEDDGQRAARHLEQTESNWRRQFFSSEALDEACVRFGAASDDAMVARSACSIAADEGGVRVGERALRQIEQGGDQGTREGAKATLALLPAG
jgi:hypothetical protein